MEKDRTYRTISVIALIVAVVALSIGYAAFSTSLSISSSATVDVNNNLFEGQVVYTKNTYNGNYVDLVTCEDATTSNFNSSDTWLSNITLSSDKTTISNINVPFTEPGQRVILKFTVTNLSEDFNAYLESYGVDNDTFSIDTTSSYSYSGSAFENDESDIDLEDYLENFAIAIYVDDDVDVQYDYNPSNNFSLENLIDGHNVMLNKYEDDYDTLTIYVAIDYDDKAPVLDVPITLSIPDIEFNWTTAKVGADNVN